MFVIHIFIIKFFFYVNGLNTIIELYFLIKTILNFIPYSTAFVSRSHDHPSRARILTSAGLPFSNNLLIARPRNSVEKDPAEWTVWSLTLEWWSKSHGYIVVQWHVCIYTSRTEIARRRRKCTRIRTGTGVNNTDKYLLLQPIVARNAIVLEISASIQHIIANFFEIIKLILKN